MLGHAAQIFKTWKMLANAFNVNETDQVMNSTVLELDSEKGIYIVQPSSHKTLFCFKTILVFTAKKKSSIDALG